MNATDRSIKDARRRRRVMGATIAIVVLAGGSAAALASRSDRSSELVVKSAGSQPHDVYRADPAALPAGFTIQEDAPAPVPALDSVTRRTEVSVYADDGREIIMITGSHDALESVLPEGPTAEVDGHPDLTRVDRAGWTYLARRDPAQSRLEAVAMGFQADPSRFVERAAGLLAGDSDADPVATGDLSPFTDAVASVGYTYRSRTGQVVAVQTFATEHLDPILDHFSPMAAPFKVQGRDAYRFDSGNGNLVIVTTGSGGELVVVAASDRTVGTKALVQIASSLRKG